MADFVGKPLPARQISNASSTASHSTTSRNDFAKLVCLGKGSVGKVYLVQHKTKNKLYAMKVLSKQDMIERDKVKRVINERDILKQLNHPFIVKLHYTFQTNDKLYMVMTYCAGGEFFRLLRTKKDKQLEQKHATFYAAEILLALEYLHLLGIIYRDLKPENILIHGSGHLMLADFDLSWISKDSKSHIAITPTSKRKLSKPSTWINANNTKSEIQDTSNNTLKKKSSVSSISKMMKKLSPKSSNKSQFTFGAGTSPKHKDMTVFTDIDSGLVHSSTKSVSPMLSKSNHPESIRNLRVQRANSIVGTDEYMSPEMIMGSSYAGDIDWWCFGIVLFEMIYGVLPFVGEDQIGTFAKIADTQEKLKFPSRMFFKVGHDCRSLLRKLLNKNVEDRMMSPEAIKRSSFFKDIDFALIRNEKPPMIPKLKSDNDVSYSHMYGASSGNVSDDTVVDESETRFDSATNDEAAKWLTIDIPDLGDVQSSEKEGRKDSIPNIQDQSRVFGSFDYEDHSHNNFWKE